MSKPNGDEPPAYPGGPQQPQPAYQQQQPHPSQQQPGGYPPPQDGMYGMPPQGGYYQPGPQMGYYQQQPGYGPGGYPRSRATTASQATTHRVSTRTSGRADLASPRPCWPVWPAAAAWTVCCSKAQETKRKEEIFTDGRINPGGNKRCGYKALFSDYGTTSAGTLGPRRLRLYDTKE
ncbi:hypothetical protein PG995_010037 [Apiospora arundinis]